MKGFMICHMLVCIPYKIKIWIRSATKLSVEYQAIEKKMRTSKLIIEKKINKNKQEMSTVLLQILVLHVIWLTRDLLFSLWLLAYPRTGYTSVSMKPKRSWNIMFWALMNIFIFISSSSSLCSIYSLYQVTFVRVTSYRLLFFPHLRKIQWVHFLAPFANKSACAQNYYALK